MKKILWMSILVFSACSALVMAQEETKTDGPRGPRGPRPEFFTEKGIDLSKLPESMPDQRKEELKSADKDGDGFVSWEEGKALAPRGPRRGGPDADRGPRHGGPNADRGPRRGGPNADRGPRHGGPNADRGPRHGGPNADRGPMWGRPIFFTEKGIDLGILQAADKDGDGFVSWEEGKDLFTGRPSDAPREGSPMSEEKPAEEVTPNDAEAK